MKLRIELQEQRVFINHYQCDKCPNEWEDEMLTVGPSWCPCCDARIEPYLSVEFTERRPTFVEESAAIYLRKDAA